MAIQTDIAVWRDCIRTWYPDYESKTYFVPPVVITRIPFDVIQVAGQDVVVPHCNSAQDATTQTKKNSVKGLAAPQESDTREDLALERVRFWLRELTSEHGEPMFVISQLPFSNYLSKSMYETLTKHLSRPRNLSQEYRRGSFDILAIHRHYGIFSGQVKSVLSNQHHLQLSQEDVESAVADRVKDSISQLNKSETVLREIMKEVGHNIAIHKILIMPYVTASTLNKALSRSQQLIDDLLKCLQAVDVQEAIDRCLLSDDMSVDWTERTNVHQFQTWWSRRSGDVSNDNVMTSDIYLDLLARFCGPATTVSVYYPASPRIEVRTEGQGVAVLGKRMTSIVLTSEQITVLSTAVPRAMLTGPPGVGKSVMLFLMALKWLSQGFDVHLVSVWSFSYAATCALTDQIQITIQTAHASVQKVGSVHLHAFDFYNREMDVDKAIETLTATRLSQGPYIVCDEFTASNSTLSRYQRFVTEICSRQPNVFLWVASVYHDQRLPELREERLTTPLRCPPAVLREVEKGVKGANDIQPYTSTALPEPCDGPSVINLSHQGPGHDGRWPMECFKCGESIAGVLQRLDFDRNDSPATRASTNDLPRNSANASRTTCCPALRYKDVFVLTRNTDLEELEQVTSEHHGMMLGLRNSGIPLRVVRKGHELEDLCDIAKAQDNAVFVAEYGAVSGLERKVVVWVPSRRSGTDDSLTNEELETLGRLFAMSRCTAQLVVIDVPLPVENRDVAVHKIRKRRRCCLS